MRLYLVWFAMLAACNPFGGDEEACAPLEPTSPRLASWTPPVFVPGAIRQSTLTYGGDRAVIVGGEGADNIVTRYFR